MYFWDEKSITDDPVLVFGYVGIFVGNTLVTILVSLLEDDVCCLLLAQAHLLWLMPWKPQVAVYFWS